MNQRLAQVAIYTEKVMSVDLTGHSMDHIRRVVALAEKILETESSANHLIVITAAYLHDTVDDKVVKDSQVAFEKLNHFLSELEYSSVEIQHIIHIIQNMSYSKSLGNQAEKLSIEGQIVQDADRLDALGAIGILRTAYYGGSQGYPIYDAEIKPVNYKKKEEYRTGSTVINHFYEKLLLLAEKMNTDYAKKEGQRRTQFMKEFLSEFFLEWQD